MQHVRGRAAETARRRRRLATVVPVQVAGGAVRADRHQAHATQTGRGEEVVHVARVAVRVQPDVREPNVAGVPVPARHAHVQQVQGEAVRAEEPVPVPGRAGRVQEHQRPERRGQNSHGRQSDNEPHRRVHAAQLAVLVHGQHIRVPEPHTGRLCARRAVRGRQRERGCEKRRPRRYRQLHDHSHRYRDRGNLQQWFGIIPADCRA